MGAWECVYAMATRTMTMTATAPMAPRNPQLQLWGLRGFWGGGGE